KRLHEPDERPRHHRKQQWRPHGHRKQLTGKIIDRREERRRKRRKPEPVEREPPPARRMADTAQTPPAASVQSSNAYEHESEHNLEHRSIIVDLVTERRGQYRGGGRSPRCLSSAAACRRSWSSSSSRSWWSARNDCPRSGECLRGRSGSCEVPAPSSARR